MPPELTERDGPDGPDADGGAVNGTINGTVNGTVNGATRLDDSAAALAGLDALDTPRVVQVPWWRRALGAGLPPLVASVLWTSISRAFLGFLVALVLATPLGLLVARVQVVRSAIGPLLHGLQSLPSVAWVPAAVLWFGLTDSTIYFVVLLGSIPSIANGLVA